MIPIQIVGAVVLLIALVLMLKELRGRSIDLPSVALVLVLCILVAITVVPQQFAQLISGLAFYRPLDAFLTIASVSALLLCLRISLRLDDLDRNITRVVRHLALTESERKTRKEGTS